MLVNNALTTLEQAKDYLGIPAEDTSQDTSIEFLIATATSIIETYCERKFGLASYQEIRPGRGTTKLILNNYPVIELKQLIVDGQTLNVSEVIVIKDSGMLYRPNGIFPAKVVGGRFLHPKPDEFQPNTFIEYTSGYVLPKDATEENPRTLPYDLEMACLRIISIAKKDKELASGRNMILKREQIGDWIGEYEPEVPNNNTKLDYMDLDILSTLEHYRRTEFTV